MALATLWANDIVDGTEVFANVPNGLKVKVTDVLIQRGHADLAV